MLGRGGEAKTTTEIVLFEIKGDSDDIQVSEPLRKVSPKPLKQVSAPPEKVEPAPDLASELDSELSMTKTASPVNADQASSRFGTKEGREVSAQERYRVELQAMLEKKKEYPLLARRLRQQGKVLVRFTLQRDGTVVAAEVVENSEFESLNRAAQKLITGISGLKPFPEDVKKNQWVFVLPVEYRM